MSKSRKRSLHRFANAIWRWFAPPSPLPSSETYDIVVLEERILYSATPLPMDGLSLPDLDSDFSNLMDLTSELASADGTDWTINIGDIFASSNDLEQPLDVPTALPADSQPSSDTNLESENRLILIDSSLDDLESLLASIDERADVLWLSDEVNGIALITEYLNSHDTLYSSIQIVTHGGAGSIELGSETISLDTIGLYADQLSAWKNYLDLEADILIYGCETAASDEGKALLTSISVMTGADVAASTDLTGYAAYGGNWDLEFKIGSIGTDNILTDESASDWQHVLSIYTVTNTNDSGSGSLRQAITNANSNAGADTINFSISGTGVHTINLSSVLPNITEQVTIDATTDDSYAANSNKAAIILDGNNLTGSGFIFEYTADNSVVRGLVIRDFAGNGITIYGGADGITLTGNFIGALNASGAYVAGEENTGMGIWTSGANGIIGGATSALRNVISGNYIGIQIDGSGATGNKVMGNYVGVDYNGSTSIANSATGIAVTGTASGNYIGTDLNGSNDSSEGNVVSSNTNVQIQLWDGDNNFVRGNKVGVNAAVTSTFDTNSVGIQLGSGSSGNTIGGTSSNASNVIGGQLYHGIELLGSGTTGNTIQRNYIGTDSAGLLSLGNTVGINIQSPAASNSIGGTSSNAGNTIAYNYEDGIRIADGSTSNPILRNSIFSNGSTANDLGIDLSTNGPNANDTGDGDSGANNLQNYAVITSVKTGNTYVWITGTLNSNANSYYRVEYFANSSADQSGYGEGKRYLGSANVATDGTGNATLSSTLTTSVAVGEYITATVTQSNSGYSSFTNTSEFALSVQAVLSQEMAVASNDSFSTNEDNNLVFDPRANDVDANGDSKSILDFTSTTNGTTTYTGDGTLTYAPNSNYFGSDSLTYLVADSGQEITHFWTFNGTGTDVVGGSTATQFGTPTAISGRFNQAFSFNETNQYLTINDFAYNTSFSISFAFKVDDNSGSWFQYMYSHGTVSTAQSLNIYIGEAGVGAYANQMFTNLSDINDAAYNQELNFDISSIINDGQWHTYTLSVESGVGSKVYLDGTLKASSSRGGDAFDPSGSLYIAARQDLDVDRFYGGAIDNLFVADRTFTANEALGWHNQSNRGSVNITINAVNDAPTITNGYTYSYSSIDENSTSSGSLASSILSASNWSDIDPSPSNGLAITGKTGNGTWQYSTDGVTWQSIGSVSSTNALLISSDTQIRYVGDNSNAETATFSYKAWDRTTGVASTNASPSYATTAASGGTTAFSSNSSSAQIIVTGLNDAPTIANGYTYNLTGTNENTNSSGTLASTILTGASWNDVDSSPSSGLAITGKTGNGTWQYSTDGSTWQSFGAVSSTNALLITSTTQVRYVPDSANGETATFIYKAWDQTTGTASTNATPSYATTASSGGATAFSSNSSSAQIVVTSVNDPSVLSTIEGSTLAYTENDGAVAITASLAVADVDDTNIESALVAITGNYTSGEDVLSFIDQNGITGSWNAGTGELTLTGSATKAQYAAALQSITYTNSSENPSTSTRTVSFTINDGDVDSNTVTRDIAITSVNDDPINAGSLPADIAVTEDVLSNVDLSTLDFSDVDAASSSLTVTLTTATGGQLTVAAGTGIT
ncbi:MAG: DUF4347 domain-containing protein, partial [Planctomycetales bacterium]|nr:DUF4347 domain-containing protein [Planctomycetales bacterium]